MAVLGRERAGSRMVWEDCSASSSFSSEVAAAAIAEADGRRVCDGKVDSRNCCLGEGS
jgi:hypothetical protein